MSVIAGLGSARCRPRPQFVTPLSQRFALETRVMFDAAGAVTADAQLEADQAARDDAAFDQAGPGEPGRSGAGDQIARPIEPNSRVSDTGDRPATPAGPADPAAAGSDDPETQAILDALARPPDAVLAADARSDPDPGPADSETTAILAALSTPAQTSVSRETGPTVSDPIDDGGLVPPRPSEAGEPSTVTVAVIDAAVETPGAILAGFDPGTDVVHLDPNRDGVAEIAEALAGRTDIDAIHIFAHGSDGAFDLGTASLTAATLGTHTPNLVAIGAALADGGDLLIYGCDIAATTNGQAFVDDLSRIIGADVAASIDDTGAAAHGGDWDLEYRAGEIDGAHNALMTNTAPHWNGLLNAPVVASQQATGELTHVQTYTDGSGSIQALDGATGTVISSDGNHVYVASFYEDSITLFSRNSSNGTLTYQQVYTNGSDGITGLSRLTTLVISPDGKHVYVPISSSDSIVIFSRNSGDGTLTYVDTLVDDLDEIDGLDGAIDIAFSSDGEDAYVVGSTESSVTHFTRNSSTGALTFQTKVTDDDGGVDNLSTPHRAAISPDDKHIYVTSRIEDAVTVFSRDAGAGTLTFVEAKVHGHDGINTLDRAHGVAISPDGASVYISSLSSQSITVFSRDSSTGQLTFQEAHKHNVDWVTGLLAPHELIIDPDGNNVYVADRSGNALTVFLRDLDTGRLSLQEVVRDGQAGVDGLNTPFFPVISQDGAHLYISGAIDDSITLFTRDETHQQNSTISFIEGSGPIDLMPLGFITGGDSATLASMTLTIANTPDGVAESLSVNGALPAGITVTPYESDTGRLVLSGAVDPADYQTALRQIQYDNTSAAPEISDRSVSVTVVDGSNSATALVTIQVTALNDAPVLSSGASPVLTTIAVNTPAGVNTGTSVADIVVDGSITDADGAVEAIAVTAVDNTNGHWQYSINNGTTWNNFTATGDAVVDLASAAVLLDGTPSGASTNRVRFLPDLDFAGSATITIRAWDKTISVAGGSANVSILGVGGTTAFSVNTNTASISVFDTVTVTTAATDVNTQTTGGLVISPGAGDTNATHFKITNIAGGTLYLNDGASVVTADSFVTVAQAAAGLKFTPTPDSSDDGSFDVRASTSDSDGTLYGDTVTATITVTEIADTPSITDTTTEIGTQTTDGLVITRNPADSDLVTHFKITNITGGNLFHNDGVTGIVDGAFITIAEGAAGLRFTPTDTTAGFDVQASTGTADAGLGGTIVPAGISVLSTPVTPPPSGGSPPSAEPPPPSGDPTTPETPQTPEDPSPPTEPAVPATPEPPNQPPTTDDPTGPETPQTPEDPSTPTEPAVPATPEPPDQPVTPEAPAPPEAPTSVEPVVTSDPSRANRDPAPTNTQPGQPTAQPPTATDDTSTADASTSPTPTAGFDTGSGSALGTSDAAVSATSIGTAPDVGPGVRSGFDAASTATTGGVPSVDTSGMGDATVGGAGVDTAPADTLVDQDAGSDVAVLVAALPGGRDGPAAAAAASAAPAASDATASSQAAAANANEPGGAGASSPGAPSGAAANQTAETEARDGPAADPDAKDQPGSHGVGAREALTTALGAVDALIDASGANIDQKTLEAVKTSLANGTATPDQLLSLVNHPGLDPEARQNLADALYDALHHSHSVLFSGALSDIRAGHLSDPFEQFSIDDRDAASFLPAITRPNVALLIGINDYRGGISPLYTPLNDVAAIGSILNERAGYQSIVLNNPGQLDIVRALAALSKTTATIDDLVIYYAGHGYMMEQTGVGYWLPADAEPGSARNWLSVGHLSAFLNQIGADQILVISDSCYSGTLTDQLQVTADRADTDRPEDATDRRSVMVMSSGGDEPVRDDGTGGHSVFAAQLIERLEKGFAGDHGFQIFADVRDRVKTVTYQEPEYGAVIAAGHTRGTDFRFTPEPR